MQLQAKLRRMESIRAGLKICLKKDAPVHNNFTLKYMIMNASDLTGKTYERTNEQVLTAIDDLRILICKYLSKIKEIIN